MDNLKNIVRQIRQGEFVQGASLDGDVLSYEGKTYKVQGSKRLRITEVKEGKVSTKKTNKPAVDSEQVCEECGSVFVKSKFNPYFTTCQTCRNSHKRRRTGGEARTFTCPECGQDFTISKFQPYLNPERCPKCTRVKQRKTRRAAKSAANSAT